MKNRPRILFFGFSDVGYKCLKLLLDKGCDVIGVFTHDTDPHEAHYDTSRGLQLGVRHWFYEDFVGHFLVLHAS